MAKAQEASHDIQLKRVYESLVEKDEQLKKDLQVTFNEVRLLVVGKTGAGKTTLIRLVLGDKGPRTITHGTVGVQDINKEWRHPDLPLIIHDSNGIDARGQERMEDIARFLGSSRISRVNATEYARRVHAVWYVFSAVDNRVSVDGGLLQKLDGYGNSLPLLLVMTHNDVAEAIGDGREEIVLDQVLRRISDGERRTNLKKSIVRLGNKIELDKATGEIVRKIKVDEKGLKLLAERTMSLLDKTRWSTWAACQAVDMNAKLEASTKLIVGKRQDQAWASFFLGVLPGIHQVQMGFTFTGVTETLAKIWNADKKLQAAITTCRYVKDERWRAVSSTLEKNTKTALALLAVAVQAVPSDSKQKLKFFTTLLGPAIAKELNDESGLEKLGKALWSCIDQSKDSSKLLMSYALHVLGGAMYVHIHDIAGKGSVDDYVQLYEEYFLRSRWPAEISRYAEGHEFGCDDEEQNRLLRSNLVKFLENLCNARSEGTAINVTAESEGTAGN